MKFNEYMITINEEVTPASLDKTSIPAKLQYNIKVPSTNSTEETDEENVEKDADQKGTVISFNGVTATKIIKQLKLIVNNKAPRTFIMMASSPDEIVIFDNKTDWKSFLDLNMAKEEEEKETPKENSEKKEPEITKPKEKESTETK